MSVDRRDKNDDNDVKRQVVNMPHNHGYHNVQLRRYCDFLFFMSTFTSARKMNSSPNVDIMTTN